MSGGIEYPEDSKIVFKHISGFDAIFYHKPVSDKVVTEITFNEYIISSFEYDTAIVGIGDTAVFNISEWSQKIKAKQEKVVVDIG